jgi:hypothetical protein
MNNNAHWDLRTVAIVSFCAGIVFAYVIRAML